MRAEVATIFVETMLARLEVPETFKVEPKRPVPEIFEAVRFDETMFARLLVPVTFNEVPDRDVPEMFVAMRFVDTIFARLLVPEMLAVVDLVEPVMREVHSKLSTFDVPEMFIVDPTS